MLEHVFLDCVCVEASSVGEARRLLPGHGWSLILLDLVLPDGDGLELLGDIRWPVMVLTMNDDPGARSDALRAGVIAVASKADSPERIVGLIRSILSGRMASHAGSARDAVRLSTRERQVLRHLLAGRPMSEMASSLGVSPTTLQSYKSRLFVKLDVDSIPQLVRVATALRI